jgi:hypothetical protein
MNIAGVEVVSMRAAEMQESIETWLSNGLHGTYVKSFEPAGKHPDDFDATVYTIQPSQSMAPTVRLSVDKSGSVGIILSTAYAKKDKFLWGFEPADYPADAMLNLLTAISIGAARLARHKFSLGNYVLELRGSDFVTLKDVLPGMRDANEKKRGTKFTSHLDLPPWRAQK